MKYKAELIGLLVGGVMCAVILYWPQINAPKPMSVGHALDAIHSCQYGVASVDYDKGDPIKLYAVVCNESPTNDCEIQFLRTHDRLDKDSRAFCARTPDEYNPRAVTPMAMHPTAEEYYGHSQRFLKLREVF